MNELRKDQEKHFERKSGSSPYHTVVQKFSQLEQRDFTLLASLVNAVEWAVIQELDLMRYYTKLLTERL